MIEKRITILITGIGAPLAQSITKAALTSKRQYRIITTDLFEYDTGVFPQLPFATLPRFDSPEYENALNKLIKDEHVDLVFLGSEKEMICISKIKEKIEKESKAKIAISSKNSLTIGMDKLLSVELLRDHGIAYPKTISLNDELDNIRKFINNLSYPFIVKGQRAGSPNIVEDEMDLLYYKEKYSDGILQEFLGKPNDYEYTVGAFCTQEHGVIDTFCMKRILKYGLTWRGWYEKNTEIDRTVRMALKALAPTGSVNVQLRYHNGSPVIHEFNVRCSSTTVFRALSGWNEIDMAVDYFLYKKKPSTPIITPGVAVRFFSENWIARNEETSQDILLSGEGVPL